MNWAWLLTGIGLGLVGGVFISCLFGLAKESNRQNEIDFWRLKLEEIEKGGNA